MCYVLEFLLPLGDTDINLELARNRVLKHGNVHLHENGLKIIFQHEIADSSKMTLIREPKSCVYDVHMHEHAGSKMN